MTRIIGSGSCLLRNPGLVAAIERVYNLGIVSSTGETSWDGGKLNVGLNDKGSACVGAALFLIDGN